MSGISFMITQAQKEALYGRGLTDEEITQLTPERAHEILNTPDRRAVREFVETIVAQAIAAQARAEKRLSEGLLQMILVHPLTDLSLCARRSRAGRANDTRGCERERSRP